AIGDRLRQIRFPADSIVQRKLGRHFPCICRIDGEESLLHVMAIRSSLKKRRNLPRHEITQSQTGCLTVNRECSRGRKVVVRIEPGMIGSDTEGYLMRSTHKTQIVIQL